jgi:hypothetical protein
LHQLLAAIDVKAAELTDPEGCACSPDRFTVQDATQRFRWTASY